jgi:hypothetical protein
MFLVIYDSLLTLYRVRVLGKEYPTLAFHSSLTHPFGKGAMIVLLRQFAKLHPEKKQLAIGFVGTCQKIAFATPIHHFSLRISKCWQKFCDQYLEIQESLPGGTYSWSNKSLAMYLELFFL